MKKNFKLVWLSVFVTFIMCFSVLSVPVSALEGEETLPMIRTENVTVAQVTKTVEVKVVMDNNPGVANMILHISYDTDYLTLTNVTDGGLIGSNLHSTDYTAVPYTLCWANDTVTNDYTSNGTIATLTFDVKEDIPEGDYTFWITYDNEELDEILNADMEKVDFAVGYGTLTIDGSIPDFLIGDVNDDGEVTMKDLTLLRRYLANWAGVEINMSAADVNGDGEVTMKDVTILNRYLAGWDVTLG